MSKDRRIFTEILATKLEIDEKVNSSRFATEEGKRKNPEMLNVN